MSANDPRFTFFLDDQDNQPLLIARGRDRLPVSDRIRAVVQLWQQGGPIAARIDLLAAELRQARLARDSPTTDVRRTKISFDLGASRLRALAQARVDDGIPASERVRAALQIWRQDPKFQAEVDELAAKLRRNRRTKSSGEATTARPLQRSGPEREVVEAN